MRRGRFLMGPGVVLIAALGACALARAAGADVADTSALGRLRSEARALRPLARSTLGRKFLDATSALAPAGARVIWRDSSRTHAWSDRDAATLPDSVRARLIRRELDETFYWNTRYGSPLAYFRPLEILAEQGTLEVYARRVADFGCGMIGQLRLLALLGADAIGIDVDPVLAALYSEGDDLGAVRGTRATRGRAELVIGQWPGDAATRERVGGRYDLILSKNTLKNGYIHPAEPVDPRAMVRLGVSDGEFVAALYGALRPGGRVLIYNLCPAPAAPGKPYIPWADGRCPFPDSSWRAAGFRVLAFDRDDSEAARAMGHALGWDRGESPMDLAHDLFATWSLFEKPP
jgi:SAM-dependent methyltransferase